MHDEYGMSEIESQRQNHHPVVNGMCTVPLFPACGADMTQQQYLHFHQLQSQINEDPSPLHHPRLFPPHFQHQIPITQHLFQQSHHFHLFHQQQQRRPPYCQPHPHHLGQTDTSIPAFLLPSSINFSLSVNENSASGGGGGGGGGEEVDGSEGRWPSPPPHYQTSTARGIREDDTAIIKEQSWTPLDLDFDYKEKNHRREDEESGFKRFKETKIPITVDVNASNYKLFSELEAICKPGCSAATIINNNQTGSSSALTLIEPSPIDHQMDIIPASDNTSTGEEASLNKEKRQRKRTTTETKKTNKKKKQLRSIATFFETMVKQFMDNQETLHHRFLQVLEKRDEERIAIEEAWRHQEATKYMKDAIEREDRQAVATARESVIVNFIENITGESLNLPSKAREDSSNSNNSNGGRQRAGGIGTNRWPKAEVQGLIEVRSELEPRFQEPGLKGPLWEEVSSAMSAMGYPRNAKRCKEKWENINKYFKKAKDSTKKRPHYSKTCPYFHLLDQLYSKTPSSSASAAAAAPNMDHRGNSELLDAIVVSNDQIKSHLFQHASELNNSDDDHDLSAGTTVPTTTCKQKYDDDEDNEKEEEEGESLSSAPTTKSQHFEQDR